MEDAASEEELRAMQLRWRELEERRQEGRLPRPHPSPCSCASCRAWARAWVHHNANELDERRRRKDR